MDKIYTRKRIRLPYIRYVGLKNRKIGTKNKIVGQIIIILIIAIITLIIVVKSVTPIIDKICEDTAKIKATMVSNNMATEVMKNYTYKDLVNIYKDKNENITMLQSNIITINEITSDVAVKIQNELINSEESMGNIKLRCYYWN